MPASLERANGAGPARGRVFFLCAGNSARSQMAEALVNHHLRAQWEAHSADHGESFDLVVTLCGNAESCPLWLGGGALVHRSVPDPAAVEGPRAERLEAFQRTRDAIARDVLDLLRPLGISHELDLPFVHH